MILGYQLNYPNLSLCLFSASFSLSFPFFFLSPSFSSLFTYQPFTLCWFKKGLVDEACETDGNCLEIVGSNVGGSIWGIWESGHSYVANNLNLRTVESENSEKLKENKDLWSRSGKKCNEVSGSEEESFKSS